MGEINLKRPDEKFLFWIEKSKFRSVDLDYRTKTVIFYDEKGTILLIRYGVTWLQMHEIECAIKNLKFKKSKATYFFGGN